MNIFTQKETYENMVQTGVNKAALPPVKVFIMGILAGVFIAFSGVVSNTVAFGFDNVSVVRMLSGLFFPFGLAMVIVMGTELFTGNCLMSMALLQKKITWGGMLKNWVFAYIGNFLGSALIAALVVYCGQVGLGGGELATFTIKVATTKASMGFGSAIVSGILCNLLVCTAVLISSAAKDVPGRIMGAFLPVCFFVTAGFEHSVANMYYVPAGLFALQNPAFAQSAADAGIAVQNLTWGAFFANNLLPVTIGNIIGGSICVGLVLWFLYVRQKAPKANAEIKLSH